MQQQKSIAFLHTASVHKATFESLMQKLAPDVTVHHVTEDALLADTMAAGRVTDDIVDRLLARLQEAAATDADLLVCTCSTLGGPAEEIGADAGLKVLRIDRAMAERAIEIGKRIAVMACIDSTLGPTMDLLQGIARDRNYAPDFQTLVIEGAWTFFLDGKVEDYYDTIEAALRGAAGSADVIVLAQASMAPAADRCRDLDLPILSSPELGVRYAVDLLS